MPYEEAGRRRMIRFLNPTGGWINLKKKVPIYVAASGPKTLELAGEIGDGVILGAWASRILIRMMSCPYASGLGTLSCGRPSIPRTRNRDSRLC